MKQADILLCNPRHMDYVWFKYNLTWIKPFFNKVYIAITQGLEPDLTQWIVNASEYKDVKWVRPPKSDGKNDWRNLAVRDMLLNFSKAPYVLFLEQDFLIKDLNFFIQIFSALEKYDWVYYKEVDRIHPSFSLVKRELLDKTCLDFSAHPPHDHFGEVFRELEKIVDKKIELKALGLKEKEDWYHLAGLSNNFWVHQLKQPFYKPEEFLAFNYLCQQLPIKIIPQFESLMKEIENQHGKGNMEGFIKNFFPEEVIEGG